MRPKRVDPRRSYKIYPMLNGKIAVTVLLVALHGFVSVFVLSGQAFATSISNGKFAYSRYLSLSPINTDIFEFDPATLAHGNLTNSSDMEIDPEWSPDGRELAYASDVDGDYEIYVRESSGHIAQITNNTEDDTDPTWSPDGRYLAFEKKLDKKEIFTISRSGGSEVNLSRSTGLDDTSPAWSPVDSRIAYASKRDGGSDYEICVHHPDGNVACLTDNSFDDTHPTWSPDGSSIAFMRDISGNFDLFTVSSSGGGQTDITNTAAPAKEGAPDWSPDGTKIAFLYVNEPTWDLQTASPNGSGRISITSLGEYTDTISWQPVVHEGDVNNPGGGTAGHAYLKLTRPKAKPFKTRRISRRHLFYILRTGGFKGKASGFTKLKGTFYRQVYKKRSRRKSKYSSKHTSKKRSKHRLKRCYTIMRKRASCKKLRTRGIKSEGNVAKTRFAYRPLGYGKKLRRKLIRLKRGKKIRRGTYILMVRGTDQAGRQITYTFKFRVRK